MVKNYKRQCGYDVGGLQPWVYLIPYSPDKFSYIIDNGECHALSLNDEGGLIRIDGVNPLLQNNESLGGRIKYESQVTISVHEPLGTNLFDKLKHIVTNKWFVVCEDKKGNQFVQSVEFFSEAEYTLTLTDNAIGQNRAELRFKGASNFPTMYLTNRIFKSETEAFIGNVCGFKKGGAYGLRMIEAAYTSLMESNHNVSAIIATGGKMFKDVDFMPTTFTFTETYAGGVFEDSLTFAIPLSAYKAYWQNSLVEFNDNRYVATFRTAEDMLYVMGFNVGAVPSYTIETGNAVNVANKITITLRYVGEDGFYVSALSDDAVFKGNDDILWMPASDFVLGGIPTKECSGGGKAKILLVEQHSTSGEGLGKYMVLSGYREQFSGLDIIDEYDIDDTSFGFPLIVDMPTCGGGECNTENGIPNPIIFTEAGTRQYTFKTDCPYSLYNVPSWLNVSIVGSNVTFAMPNPPSLGTEATFYISVADGTQYPFNIHYIKNHLFYSYTNGTYSLIPWTSTTLTKDDNNGANAVIISDLGGAIAYLSDNAFNTCPNLREVSFPNLMSITGESAFANCKNLETCYIPKISNIPSWTFWQGDMFGKLSSLTFDSSNTRWIGERAFMGEPKIGNLYLPKCSSIGEYGYYVFFPTEIAPTMSYINAPSLQVVDSHCFQSQTNLRSVSMDNVRKVSHYGFADCTNLSYISLPNVSRLDWDCFKGCYSLKDIYLYSSVLVSWDTNMGTFSYCNSDLTIHIPKSMCELYYDVYGSQIVTLDGGKNVMLGDMFSCDYGSGSVTQYYKVYNTTDGNGTITINPSKARYEENAWVNINAAPNVGYSFVRFMYGSTIDYGSVMLDSSFALEMKNDWYVSAVFSSTSTYKIYLGEVENGSLFINPSKETYNSDESITITNAASSGYGLSYYLYGSTSAYGASTSENPLYLTMSQDWYVSAVFKSVSENQYHVYLANDGNGVVTADPSKSYYVSSDIVAIGNTPNAGYSLSYYVYGSTIDYGSMMSISQFNLPMTNDWYVSGVFASSSVTPSGSQLFYDYGGGTEQYHTYPSTALTQDYYNGSLAHVIKDMYGGITIIPMRGFVNCSLLQEVSFSGVTEIGDYAFASNSQLISVDLPNLMIVGSYAFRSCHALPSITLDRAEKLGYSVFTNCFSLTDVYLGWSSVVSIPMISRNFSSCDSNLKIHVPSSLCEAYNSAYGSYSVKLNNLTTSKYFSEIFVCDYTPSSSLPPIQGYKIIKGNVTGGTISTNPLKTTYNSGEVVNISIIPNKGYSFQNFMYGSTSTYGSTTTSAAFDYTMSHDLYISASLTLGNTLFYSYLDGTTSYIAHSGGTITSDMYSGSNAVIISDIANVITYISTFSGHQSIEKLYFGNVNTLDSETFAYCPNLKEVHLDTLRYLYSYAFMEDGNLTDVYFGSFVSMSGASSMFYRCNSNLKIHVPESLCEIYNTTYGKTSVYLQGGWKYYSEIFNCDYSSSAVPPESSYYKIYPSTDGYGTISFTPSQESYLFNDYVIMDATPYAGYLFSCYEYGSTSAYGSKWTNPTQTFHMTSDLYVKALFSLQPQFHVYTSEEGVGGIRITPNKESYASDENITIEAVLVQDYYTGKYYSFKYYEYGSTSAYGSSTTLSTFSLSMTNDWYIKGVFESALSRSYTITQHKWGSTGGINVNPSYQYYDYGSVVTFTPISVAGYDFDYYEYGSTSEFGSITYSSEFVHTMENNLHIRVNYKVASSGYHVYLSTDGNGSIYVSPSKETYNYYDQIQVSVAPNDGYVFSCYQWGVTSSYPKTDYNSVFQTNVTNNLYFKALFRPTSSSIPSTAALYYSYMNGEEQYYIHSSSTITKKIYSGSTATIIKDLSGVITHLDEKAFSECYRLQNITLPNASYLMERAFDSCSSLEYVIVPELLWIGDDVFSHCINLSYIVAPKLRNVNFEGFIGCTNLQSLNSPLETVRSRAFLGCINLSVINSPLISRIESFAFTRCSKLVSISLDNLTYLGVGAFYECVGLLSISLPMVSKIYTNTFYSCHDLQNVYLGYSSFVPIESISSVFYHCNNNLKIHVPSSLYNAYYTSYSRISVSLQGGWKYYSDILVGDL